MSASIRFVAFVFAFALAWPAVAVTGDVELATGPGTAAAAITVEASGTIKSIDAKTRTVTILGDGGKETSIVAGPDVKNFAQLAVGQRVKAEYIQGLTLELEPGSKEPVSRTVDAAVGTADEGEMPAGMIGQRVRIIAVVTQVNPETKVVTVRGPEQAVDLQLNDPEQVALIKVGDRVEAVYIEATAISVSAAK
jgi:Cu/Ag efflux protein CusF